MTPKEKAKQLVLTFMQKIIFGIKQNIEVDTIEAAKQCALFAVDEILKSMEDVMPHPPFEKYWQEVKTEIEKL